MRISEVDLNTYKEVNDIYKIQSELCNLFYNFHKICEDSKLIYNMYGGTLLGAVRHHGMIPWDDDIDVSMPREDYDKFIKIVKERYNDKYIAHVYPQKNYPYPYMKFGLKKSLLIEPLRNKYNAGTLYIDIFPIDGCHNNFDMREKVFKKLIKLKHRRGVCVDKISKRTSIKGKFMNILRHCRALLFRAVGYKRFLEKEIELSQSHDFKNSKYVCCMAASWFEKGVVTKEDYLNRKLYKFGDYEFWGMKNYDRHLTNLYGDYMQPPPEDQRISNHNYNLFFEKNYLLEENNG